MPTALKESPELELSRLLREWLRDFHAAIGPMSEEEVAARTASYLFQERLFEEKIRFLRAHIGFLPAQVLDIGSSAGGLAAALALQGCSVEGIEPSLGGVEVSRARARHLGLKNAHFRVGVGERLPFADDHFDLVISLAVLEHVENVQQVVDEAFRVLKPGGLAYFEVPNNLFPFEGHYKLPWLPMMPRWLAKPYVRLRGFYPDFLDTLHYMNRFRMFRYFRRAGFAELRDLYGEFIAGKIVGASWNNSKGRLASLPLAGAIARMLFGQSPTAWLANRAVFLLARRPFGKCMPTNP